MEGTKPEKSVRVYLWEAQYRKNLRRVPVREVRFSRFMYAAAPTSIRELYSFGLRSRTLFEGLMNHFVELTSPADAPEMQSRFPVKAIVDRLPLEGGFVDGGFENLGTSLVTS